MTVKIIDRRNAPLDYDEPEVVSNWEVTQNGKFLRGFATRKEARAYARVVREESNKP